ncbi:TPM domain-containing protein [Sorangium sp. So ce315]|uniref:TPM domain-containing protein n=1 Tax=Sorangium sp. So ce315 TaxID=3133299 RepID=UPI003F625F50
MRRLHRGARIRPVAWLAWLTLTLAVLLVSASVGATTIPPLNGYVMDDTGTLTEVDRAELSLRLNRERQSGGPEIVVLVLRSLGGEGRTIESVADSAFQQYRIGKAGADGGVLLVITEEERKVCIRTNASARGILKDEMASAIVETKIVPLLRAKRLREAIVAGTDAIMDPLRADREARSEERKFRSRIGWFIFVAIICFPILVAFALPRRFLGKSSSSTEETAPRDYNRYRTWTRSAGASSGTQHQSGSSGGDDPPVGGATGSY